MDRKWRPSLAPDKPRRVWHLDGHQIPNLPSNDCLSPESPFLQSIYRKPQNTWRCFGTHFVCDTTIWGIRQKLKLRTPLDPRLQHAPDSRILKELRNVRGMMEIELVHFNAS
jgi:hypothetical protein